MIGQERVVANTKKFFDTAKKYEFLTDKLVEILGEGFISAPASTSNNLNNAFEGGLCDHIIRVTKFACGLNSLLLEDMKIALPALIKVCFLHQIGKAHLYVKNTSEWHVKNQGKVYEFNNELVSMSVGERSAYYALTAGIELTDLEYQSIVNFTKSSDDKQAKYHSEILAIVLRSAIDLAISEEQFLIKQINK